MKDKLEPNMYVRTKGGNIFKIIGGNVDNWEIDIDYSKLEQTEENWLELYRYNDNYSFFNDKDIIKASFKIIDLIEEGDYVNGNEIYKINWDSLGLILETTDYFKLREKDIKSILTKEQFSSIEYRLECKDENI